MIFKNLENNHNLFLGEINKLQNSKQKIYVKNTYKHTYIQMRNFFKDL